MSITVSIIGRNEEDNISRCIKSVLPIADLVVYADTGSTDSTVGIVESLANKTHKITIRHITFDDFAQARNEAKKGVPGDWILQIDADETLNNASKLHTLCGPDEFKEAYLFSQEHLILGGNKTSVVMRLFKNREHYQYVGCIHEMPENIQVTGPDKAIEPFAFIQGIYFAHYGCVDEQLRRAKVSNRNLELLIKDLRVNPDRSYNKYLMIRDYLNIYKWRTAANGFRCTYNSIEHQLLCAIIRDHDQYKDIVLPRYQELASEVCATAYSLLAQQEMQLIETDLQPTALLSLGLS
jgi:glycosyltransferase involved in cell wall biosynthesis